MEEKEDTCRFMFTVEKEILEKFKKAAKREGRSASNLMAKLVRDYVKNTKQ